MENTLFVCDCEDVDHQFVVSFDSDCYFNDQIIFHVHLQEIGFWKRLLYALRYIFGKKSKYGSFGEILLDKEKVCDLTDVLTKHYLRMSDGSK